MEARKRIAAQLRRWKYRQRVREILALYPHYEERGRLDKALRVVRRMRAIAETRQR